jgi:hypothetical protein
MKRKIPVKDADFHEKQELITSYTSQKKSDWGINSEWYTTLLQAKAAWVLAYAAWMNHKTRTELITAAKNRARKAYEKLLSLLIDMLRSNPLVTDADLDAMDIAVTKRDGSRNPDPEISPILKFLLHMRLRIVIEFGTKPHGVHGVEFLIKVGGEMPKSVEEFDYSAFDTHSPYMLEFVEGQEHKVVYIMARYESTTGGKGPWTTIYTVSIP